MDGERHPAEKLRPPGLEEALSTLRDDAYRDFVLAEEEAPSGSGILTLECIIRDDRLVPLDEAAASRVPFDEIARAVTMASETSGAVLPDHLVLTGPADGESGMRLMIIGDGVVEDMLSDLAQGKRIPRSELRLAKQLVCGSNLSEAAARDGLSHETKRSQYKSLAHKLGARSQGDLVARILTRLLLATGGAALPERSRDLRAITALIRAFVPSARVHAMRGTDDLDHVMVELGPADGAPFLMIHSQILPDFTDDDVAALHECGRRIIIPLRNGALSPDARPLDLARHMDHACDGIGNVLDRLGLERADIMGCISGCAYAVEYACRHPHRVASLALVGACVRPNVGTSTAGRLRAGMLQLAMRNWTIYSKAIEFYGRRIRRPETCRQLLMNVYRPCLADLAVIEAEYGPPHEGERLRRFFSTSVESIKHDFHHQAHPNWEPVSRLPMPVAFLHGTQDFIHTLANVRDLAAAAGRPVHAIEGGGQLLYHRHFRPMLAAYLAFAEASAAAGR